MPLMVEQFIGWYIVAAVMAMISIVWYAYEPEADKGSVLQNPPLLGLIGVVLGLFWPLLAVAGVVAGLGSFVAFIKRTWRERRKV